MKRHQSRRKRKKRSEELRKAVCLALV